MQQTPALRDRNIELERLLTDLAADSVGIKAWGSKISGFADFRAYPGGVRVEGRDLEMDYAEELADARNYAVWIIEQIHAAYMAGDPIACDTYERIMRSLRWVIKAFQELHTESA